MGLCTEGRGDGARHCMRGVGMGLGTARGAWGWG